MDNLQVYQVVLNGAPYVIAAYALIWATLIVVVGMTFRRLSHLERELTVLEDAVERRQKAQA